ncbi:MULTISPECIES: lipid-transfer protein [Pseudomonas]|uniref:lipid-transfer protein n=1 Tax=Pseudomonas TaxID=286 RepID=UPI0006D3B44A|nr:MULTISPECIES: lipid-transfer protein [Pseudomonas]MCE4070578.1 lipid-transfer protein [Pseudomonas nitritireducens]MCE4080552.1 lipid-transfer protein [Pseudomonas nitroreducens]OBY88471.1 lipid-transfer protein [Pseudomonas sp. AU11447]
MSNKVFVAGVGMIQFKKPGTSDSYDVMGEQAIRLALADAGLDFAAIQQAYAGYVYGDSTCGQKAMYRVGMTGIPLVNVNNNCATGSSALFLARQAVQSGMVDCALAFGFEQMNPGALKSAWTDRAPATERALQLTNELIGQPDLPTAIRQFAGAGYAHMQKYGTKLETFAAIRAKASRHAARNPLAVFRNVVSTEEVMAAPMLWEGVLTRLMACPPTCGGAAAIVVSERFAKKHGLRTDVMIAGQALATDLPSTYDTRDMIRVVGFDMTRLAATQAYEQAGVGPQDVQVVELHDCFAQNELLTYEGLGLCPEGGGEQFVLDGDNTYGGKWVTNPSGGLLSKGHPLGATGLAQCFELTHQLRGSAGDRQVEGARIALQHNLGLGGAGVVTLYQKN